MYFPFVVLFLFTGIMSFHFYQKEFNSICSSQNKFKNKRKAPEKKERKIKSKMGCKIPFLESLIEWFFRDKKWYLISLFLITTIFISIKFGMIFTYRGSYIDEYFHIFSGISLFENGKFPQYYVSEAEYRRGAYVSFFVGLLMHIFGKTISVAKMLPAFIGIVNYFLLYSLSKRVIKNKEYILLLLLIYTISPWVIFNQFYVRMYVFYELFLLLSLFLFYKIIDSIEENNFRKISFYLFLGIILNYVNYIWSYDAGKYLILLENGLLFLYIFFFEIQKIHLPESRKFFREANEVLKVGLNFKLFLTLMIFSTAYFLLNIPEKINFLFNTDVVYTSSEYFSYERFFFIMNFAFTFFFLLSPLSFHSIRPRSKLMPFIVGGFIFIIQMISSSELHMIRVIAYFLPLYYLISIYSLSELKYSVKPPYLKKLISAYIPILLLLTTFSNYPTDFLGKPGIDYEVSYMDYERAYAFVNSNLKDHIIIESSPSPHISNFYGVHPDYILITQLDRLKQEDYYIDNSTHKTVYGDIPIITDISKLENSTKKAIIVREPSENKFLTSKSTKYLEQNYECREFTNIKIFFDKKIL